MAEKTVEVSTVSQHTVMSTSTSTTATLHGDNAGTSSITCDVSYLRSVQGMTKIAEILLSLVAFIVMLASRRGGSAGLGFFVFVTILATVVSSVVLLLLTTHLHLKIRLPWNIVFAGLYGLMFILYFVTFIIGAVGSYSAPQGAAVTLAFFATVAYFASLVFAIMDWRLSHQMTQESQGATGTYTSQVESPPAYDAQY